MYNQTPLDVLSGYITGMYDLIDDLDREEVVEKTWNYVARVRNFDELTIAEIRGNIELILQKKGK